MSRDSERGAAAVEFAILLPLLLMLVLGTIEFGRAYNAQITLTNAARDGVRVMAIGNDPTAAFFDADGLTAPTLVRDEGKDRSAGQKDGQKEAAVLWFGGLGHA